MSYDVFFTYDTNNGEPIVLDSFNHTFNCTRMFCDSLRLAGLHATDGIKALDKKLAKDMKPFLSEAIMDMQNRKEYYEMFNSPNDWGNYDSVLNFLKDIEAAAIKYPNSIIEVSY